MQLSYYYFDLLRRWRLRTALVAVFIILYYCYYSKNNQPVEYYGSKPLLTSVDFFTFSYLPLNPNYNVVLKEIHNVAPIDVSGYFNHRRFGNLGQTFVYGIGSRY